MSDFQQTERTGGTTYASDGQFIHESHSGGTHRHSPHAPDTTYGQTITEARATSGAPKTGADISEDHIVKVNGMEGRIKDMLRTGTLVRTQDGTYVVPGKDAASETEETPSESPMDSMEALDMDVEAQITEVYENPALRGDLMSAITSMANTGEFNNNALDRIAATAGLEPEAARDRAETIRAAFEGQARASVEAGGLDSDDVFGWAWQNKPDLMRKAIIQQATQRNTKAYQAITDEYVKNMDKINPDAILNAQLPEGATAFQRKNGTIVIKTPQGEFDWGAAVRSGFISLSRAG